jgi:hypothetical protein
MLEGLIVDWLWRRGDVLPCPIPITVRDGNVTTLHRVNVDGGHPEKPVENASTLITMAVECVADHCGPRATPRCAKDPKNRRKTLETDLPSCS